MNLLQLRQEIISNQVPLFQKRQTRK